MTQLKTSNIEMLLTSDLTRYHPSLVSGATGTIVSLTGLNDRFARVRFADVGVIDVLWESIQITDSEYLTQQRTIEEEKLAELKNATNVVVRFGPNGAFRSLSYTVTRDGVPCQITKGSKKSALRELEYFKEIGIAIEEQREQKRKSP